MRCIEDTAIYSNRISLLLELTGYMLQSKLEPKKGDETMKTGPCPECSSTDVFFGKTRERLGGLRDEHQVYIPVDLSAPYAVTLYADTYICLNCGYVRLFVDEESMKAAAAKLPGTKGWSRV